jgi:hypothetical protein
MSRSIYGKGDKWHNIWYNNHSVQASTLWLIHPSTGQIANGQYRSVIEEVHVDLARVDGNTAPEVDVLMQFHFNDGMADTEEIDLYATGGVGQAQFHWKGPFIGPPKSGILYLAIYQPGSIADFSATVLIKTAIARDEELNFKRTVFNIPPGA